MHVVARPRIHISLADMGYVSARVFGGIGFSVDSPQTVFDFEESTRLELVGLDGIDFEGRTDLAAVVDRITRVRPNLRFRAILRSAPPQHVGFGSKTSMALALIAGVNAFCTVGWSLEEMQRLSGRGGASGVGVHAFFLGGVVWDAGHVAVSVGQLLPSGTTTATGVPPLMVRSVFPSNWRVILILPDVVPMSREEEICFFMANTPVPRDEALSTMAALYHGVLPAMICADYNALATALAEVHRIGFKLRELNRWGDSTRRVVHALSNKGVAVGISSVGPLIYVVLPEADSETLTHVRRVCDDFDTRMFSVVRGYNSGYDVRSGNWS